MSYYIGIDIGASLIKGALFELDKLEITNIVKYSTPTPSSYSVKNSENLLYEVECIKYEKIVRKIIKDLLKIQPSISGIIFSTQMHGMVLVNSNLNPITQFIGWQDERVNGNLIKNKTFLELLNNKLYGIDTKKTGIQFRSGLMGSTLFWLKETNLLKKYPNAKALFLGDYIAAKLTNGKILCHSTNACGSGLYNVKENCWDKKILKAIGISEAFLPDVTSVIKSIGRFKINNHDVPVFVSFGDMQVAIVGSLIGLRAEKEFCINIGTGSQASTVAARFMPGPYDIRSYFDNQFLNTITFIPAGRALNVLVQFIGDIGDKIYNHKRINIWEKITLLVSDKKSSNGLKSNISFFKNSISDQITGSVQGITEKNFKIENVFFSALDQMADNYYLAYKRLGKIKITDKIICAGGLGRKLIPLQSLIQDKFNRKIELAPFEEETLAGLFILSLVSRGDFTKVKEASIFVQNNKLKFK